MEDVRIVRSGEAKGGEGRLHSGGGIPQHIKVLYRAGVVADLQLNTISGKDPLVFPGELAVPGSCYPGSDHEVTGW